MFHSTLQAKSISKYFTGEAVFGFNGKEKPARMNNRSGGDDEPDDTNIDNTQPELLNNYNYALNEEFDYLDDDKPQEKEQRDESKD